jgi:hypothetical protein
LVLEGDMTWHRQFDLCSGRRTAPDFESRADSFGPLAHPLQTAVSIRSPPQFSGINPAPVVAHGDAQFAGPILDLGLDSGCPGMAASIDQRLTANAVNFGTQLCPQFSLPAMYNQSKADR